ncbi:CCR4-NOT transcription complex subunit 1 isoform X1 [Thunnus albacares]|uniref:CCR4-NOT transcription complex subunit 1 isoform X1 n=1 Tax=Thunnus maccoyii TaxID=8240 RepID=UPI001C4B2238|nr:CCR4-NOT transcription complex subunit 1 isoform X1 [Thunnus maccoyii]XP_042267824.1 CCR4-NOT transcription complex subunit 1 isoform X1 [Thunnus maccoyii]XP_042267825.1 CCR4-NOT transcription complex subunit 1 isoform X1 [Thunnus maccoyii]XP_044212344.1 CCR4-NOT transcription complex subunit 1 isoform X1 [Thunnus albacares]XP_044212345.1 CCR4-NOT transcription complex subunit 1 isoform X1 [Thunnus albacares]XP_044212346.1 CCR4-NOT transcription complex subunit 1 isoform X1 [Thunnus albacar
MNLDSLSLALSQISYLVDNLTKKNYRASQQEIQHIVNRHGPEADRHLLRCLFSHVDFSGDGKSSGKDFHQTQFLIQECVSLISKPNFISTLCYAIDNPLHYQKSLKPSAHLFTQLSKVLKLSKVQEVIFGLALLNSSNADLRGFAAQFIKQKLPDLLRSYVDADLGGNQEGGFQDIAIEVLHLLLSHLLFGQKGASGVGQEQIDAFLKTLCRDFPQERCPVVLAPLLYPEKRDILMDRILPDSGELAKTMMESSLAEFMQEVGYGFCASLDECRNIILQYGVREVTASQVARVLGMMARTHSGLTDGIPLQSISAPGSGIWSDGKDKNDGSQAHTWNVEVLIDVVKEVNPNLNFKEVTYELDHPGFIIRDSKGLHIVVYGIQRGLGMEVFPVDLIYRPWKHAEGQLSFIQHSLISPEVFCFADYPCHTVAIDILKAPPEDDNREIATWKSLDLVESLLRLSEVGQYEQVKQLFSFPIKHCPDMLVLALLQISTSWHTLRHELISTLMPIFLGNHPNSAIILHYAWHGQGQSPSIRQLIMHSMAEWYMRGEQYDQAKLSRILDVAQDLKSLSMLLNGTPFAFVIDLAALASRREYLKLDKWLTDKIREHGEPFIQACVTFLKRRCPSIMGGLAPDKDQPKSAQLPPETLATMLACLQSCAGSVSQELSETILTMVANCSNVMNKARQPPPGVMPKGRAPSTSSLDAISPVQVSPCERLITPLQENFEMPFHMDPLSGMASLSLGGTATSHTQSMQGFPTSLSSAFSNPQSPAKAFPPLSTTNPSTPFGGIGSLSSQLPGMDSGPLGSGIGSGIGSGLGMSAVSTDPFGTRKMSTPGLNPPTFQQTDLSQVWPEANQHFSKEIDDEANSYFQRIYNHPPHPTMSVDEVLEMLQRFKDSTIKREREVFNCMLRNLFEEYRFFPQYPDKELHITACLFGGIIEKGLVTYMALGLALRYVLEALRKPYGSKMYYFGIAALDRFKNRLKDYPQYCQHLASIAHFLQFPHHLQECVQYIEYGQQSRDPPVKMQGSITTPGSLALAQVQAQAQSQQPGVPKAPQPGQPSTLVTTTTTTTTVAKTTTITRPTPSSFKKDVPPSINTTNIDTLLVATDQTERIVEPPENVQEKIAFIFNNLSQSNMTQKVEELKETVKEEFMPWVSQYLVMKRVSIEPNFHSLYSNFLDTLKNPEFVKMVLNETYRNIKVLLTSDKAAANFSDRSLLKNLGHWLGMITLAKNKPILYTDLEVKSLLLEAYVKGQQELLYVVPFVAKVLESSLRSMVFRPQNPWTMAIMNVLAELHQEHDLKLNLKFEIEVLCKNLSLDINDLKPGNLLKDKEKLKSLEEQLSAPKKETKPPEEMLPVSTTGDFAPFAAPPSTPAATTTTTCTTTGPPTPQFSYHDINVYALAGLAPHININVNIPLLQAHPQLKQCVRQSVERAVQELVHPVVDRSIKIAMTTCEQIIRKDFALDSEESRMRVAAHHMMRNLTAGMAMITCREPLLMSIATNLKNSFAAALRAPTPQQREMMEEAAARIAQDNCELACCFIQKTAVEKAGPEMDKRLATEFELRKHARQEGRRYCDPVVLTYQAERMPEQIRLKVGGVDPKQLAVYEEFARNVPGFLPSNDLSQPTGFLAQPMKQQAWATDDVAQIYDKCMADLEQHLHAIPPALAMNPLTQALRSLLEAVALARNSRDGIAALGLLQKAVEGLLDATSGADADLLLRYRECHLLVLKALQDGRAYGPQWCNKQITRCLIECRDEYKYNVEAVELLIRNHLVNMQQYDLHLAQSMENGLHYMAVAFAMQLVKLLLVDERSVSHVTEADLFHTIETLMRTCAHSRANAPEGLPQLMDVVRSNYEAMIDRAHGGPNFMMHSGISQASEYDDPPGLREKAEYLLREWVNLYHSAAAGRDSTKAFSAFVGQMHQQGILKTDDLITRFFRLCTEMCVEISYRAQAEQQHNPAASAAIIRAKCYHNLDAFVRLIALLVKHSGEASNTVTKINLLNKVLGIVVGVLIQDHDVRQTEFQQLPYHRIFIMLLLELNAPEHVLETINFQTLTAFCNTFHILRPTKAPGFVYAWLELISHRIFIARMLAHTPQQKGWPMYAQLLIDLFKYLAPFLRNVELNKPMQILYKGTLRVLLVLLHDFPEFLCDYHYGFCDVIPPNCIQLRNLILSAFPRNMRLPDPFTPNLKVDMLSEINIAPRILTNFTGVMPSQFKKDLDSYLKTRSPVTFLSELRSNLQVSNEPGNRYNIQLINALVLYVGTQAIAHIHNKGSTPSMSTITHSAHMDIFQNLAVDLDTEGRYLFLNAIANQLRYPNSHTHYFSCTMLYLFAEANTEAIQEQITRVLLERLIVNRPHPWGLLITFIELIKNPAFKFWSHDFVHCAPEIEKLFQSVAQCCMGQKQAQQVMEGTGAS